MTTFFTHRIMTRGIRKNIITTNENNILPENMAVTFTYTVIQFSHQRFVLVSEHDGELRFHRIKRLF